MGSTTLLLDTMLKDTVNVLVSFYWGRWKEFSKQIHGLKVDEPSQEPGETARNHPKVMSWSPMFMLCVTPANTRASDNIMSFEIIYFKEKKNSSFKSY